MYEIAISLLPYRVVREASKWRIGIEIDLARTELYRMKPFVSVHISQ